MPGPKILPGTEVHAVNPRGKHRQEDYSEFQALLVYIASSRTARSIYRDLSQSISCPQTPKNELWILKKRMFLCPVFPDIQVRLSGSNQFSIKINSLTIVACKSLRIKDKSKQTKIFPKALRDRVRTGPKFLIPRSSSGTPQGKTPLQQQGQKKKQGIL